MKIGILQTGRSPDELRDAFGDYDSFFHRLLAGRGFEFETWPVLDGVLPNDPGEADGWLITGSRFGVYEDHHWIAPLEAFIRYCFVKAVPMVGICFGHQIIAQAMGGKVEKFAGGWSVGRTDYEFDGVEMPLNAWHQDQVVEAPEGAKTIASTDFCKYAGLLYDGHALTIQPHPEFDQGAVELLLTKRAPGLVPQDRIAAASANIDAPVANAKMADRIADFFKENSHG